MGRSRSRSRSRSRDRYRRKRSRSRSRDRYRSRSRSRDRRDRYRDERSRFLVTSTDPTVAAQMQQQQAAQHIIQQQLMGAQLPPSAQQNLNPPGQYDPSAITLDRKQREVYCGNLAIGNINGPLLEEFFNQALSHLVPDPVNMPPVINVNMDSQGRFGFVEFTSRELANFALTMDRMVEICGRHMHIGRPKGYEDPTGPPLPLSVAATVPPGQSAKKNKTLAPGAVAATAANAQPTSRAVLLTNILPVGQLRAQEERKILEDEIKVEASKYGAVETVVVPPPLPCLQERHPGRAYILYTSIDDAKKGTMVFHTRTMDDNSIKARHVSEEEYQAAVQGEWLLKHHTVHGMPLPGLYQTGLLNAGISGLAALNPALVPIVQANANLVSAITEGIDEDEVPFEEGWVKLRGFPAAVTKQHIVDFFKGCGELTEADVHTIVSSDDTPLGEAFVHFKGPKAKLRLALAKDKSPLPPVNEPAEILTSYEEDMERRVLSGYCKVV